MEQKNMTLLKCSVIILCSLIIGYSIGVNYSNQNNYNFEFKETTKDELMIIEYSPHENSSLLSIFGLNNTEILKITHDGSVYHMEEYVGKNESLPDVLTKAFNIYDEDALSGLDEVKDE
jgi:hypothetical protein